MATIRAKDIIVAVDKKRKETKLKGTYYYFCTNIKDHKTGKFHTKEIYIGSKEKLRQLNEKIIELLNK